ncbi:MAG: hypothetical protein HZA20_04045 [Nitrospirae bacterium]|nr:hypothetical protein [Nitrospirota bacterium]
MNPAAIIKIENGVVSSVYSTHPMQVLIVDYDTIEGGETIEDKMRKAVHYMTPDTYVRPEMLYHVVEMLVLACRRPMDSDVLPRIRDCYEVGA